MWTALIAVSLGGATYAPRADAQQRTVVSGEAREECYTAAPTVSFDVSGPGGASIVLYVDLPKKPAKPKAVKAVISIDGKPSSSSLKPKRAAKVRYDDAEGLAPSAALAPIELKLPAGAHTLAVTLPKGRSGCVVLRGLDRATDAPQVATAPTPPASAPPPPAPVAGSSAPVNAPAPVPPPAPPSPAASAASSVQAEAGAQEAIAVPLEEISARPAGDGAPEVERDAAAGTEASVIEQGRPRVGGFVGGVVPRADLKAGLTVGLLLELPLTTLGLPARFEIGLGTLDLGAYFSAAWSPLRQQDRVLIPGRGQTELIQQSLVVPFELGGTLRLELGAPVTPYVSLGLAAEVTRTELRAFSTPPEKQNDVALGVAVGLGASMALGPGALSAELHYREIGADLGAIGTVGEDTFSAAALHLGYSFNL